VRATHAWRLSCLPREESPFRRANADPRSVSWRGARDGATVRKTAFRDYTANFILAEIEVACASVS
jgi:hypothetical protein